MKKELLKFDFYGNNNYIVIPFSKVDINGIPIKKVYDPVRTGFHDANEKINFPTHSVKMLKHFKNECDYELFREFFVHYMVFPDLPLEFRIKEGEYGEKQVHGFIETIATTHNTEDTIFSMEISLIAYIK